jgi:competence protein ComEC
MAEVSALVAAVVVWCVLRSRGPGTAALPTTAMRRAQDRPPPRGTWRGFGRRSRWPALATAGAASVVVGAVVVAVALRPDGRLHLDVLDVGGAPAVAIQTDDGRHVLVDTGPDPQRLLQALGADLPPLTRSLDLVVLTGGDRACAGALPGLADRYSIARVVAPAGLPGTTTTAALESLQRNGTEVDLVPPDTGWSWGGVRWRLLGPPSDGPDTDVLTVTDPTGTAVLAGMLPVTAQEELAALHPDDLRANLLVTPPGGAVAPALADAVRPQLVAIPDARGARGTGAQLLTGRNVRRTGDAGSLSYVGGDAGLAAT